MAEISDLLKSLIMSEETPTQDNRTAEATEVILPIREKQNTANDHKSVKSALHTVLSQLKLYEREKPYTRLHALYLINGSVATIPDLSKIAPAWSTKAHPLSHELRVDINNWLSRISKNEDDRARHFASDVGGFAAAWAPEADYEVAKWVAHYFTWLVLWDDKFEEAMEKGDKKTAQEW